MKCTICECEISPKNAEEYHGYPLCADCAERGAEYQDRVEDRIDRLEERTRAAYQQADAIDKRLHESLNRIPGGQPVTSSGDRSFRNRLVEATRRSEKAHADAFELCERAEAAKKNQSISSDDPLAIIKVLERIAAMSDWHEHMKLVNRTVRRNAGESVDVQIQALQALGYEEDRARTLITPNRWGRAGYSEGQMKNSASSIRRFKKRLVELRKHINRPDVLDYSPVPGLIVRHNQSINRLQLIFDERPAPELRATLKGHGFRWAPSEGAWQRQLSSNAEYALQCVIEEMNDGPIE